MSNQFISSGTDGVGDIEEYFLTEYEAIEQYFGDQLWIWGNGAIGRLGNNSTTNRSTPVTTFTGGNNWKQVSCGSQYTAAIKTNGTLWVWGNGSYGALGNNVTTNRSTPVTTFAGGTNWTQVSAGGQSYCTAIKNDGTLWVWGRNQLGQLGTNDTNQSLTPITTISGGNNWKQVSAGNGHTAAIKTNGTLWTWGGGTAGSLGNNTSFARLSPGTTFAGGTNWRQVSASDFSTAAIKTDGALWVWGNNSNAQLGINNTTNRLTPVTTFAGGTNWKQVSFGINHAMAIKNDGTLWTWGNNSSAQLGNNSTTNRSTPVTTSVGGSNWKQVSAGNLYSAAIKTNGTLWTWGNNSSAQLGNNSNLSFFTPITTFAGGTDWKQVSAGDAHVAAVTAGTSPDLPFS